MDGRHGSAQQPTPRVLCSPPSFLFSRCILGACILALCHFSIVWGLGSKAWLVSLPSPTLPGEVRMELPHSAHQPRARVLCLLLGQASSVKSPGWKPQSIQPSAASSRSSLLPPHPPPRLFAGRAQSPVGGGLGGVFITPPPRGLHLLVHGGGGTPCGFLSLVGTARPWQTLMVTAGCPLPGSVLPPWPQLVLHVPEPCTEPRLVLVPPSPFPTSRFLGKPGLSMTWEAFSTPRVSPRLYRNTANTFSTMSNPENPHQGTGRRNDTRPPRKGGHAASRGQILAQNPRPENPSLVAHLFL